MTGDWQAIAGTRLDRVALGGVDVVRGSRVRLMPGAGRDIMDLTMAGRNATVESIEVDLDGSTQLVVTVDDDPARDFRDLRMPGHRFFFRTDEIVPLADDPGATPQAARILVAGIGNAFMGDDGFGVEVVRALLARNRIPDVDIIEFGIRGLDLAYAFARYRAVILVDAAARGVAPGTVAVLDPSELAFAPAIDTHGMDPVKVIGLAAQLGPLPAKLRVVVCEPADTGSPDEVTEGLSPAVREAVPLAVAEVEALIPDLLQEVAS